MRRLRIAGLALLVTTLLIILGPFLVPVPPLPCTPSAERLAGPNGTFVRIDDLDLYAEIAGQGAPALVLLHGFAASAYSFSDVLPALAQRSLVVAYDRPAFGLSSRPLWPYRDMENPYTPEAQADQAVALMDALGIDRAVLVGHSAGGGLAVLVALRHPERVQALVLVAPAVRVNDTPDWLRLVLRTPQARYLAPLAARALANALFCAYRGTWLALRPLLGLIRAGSYAAEGSGEIGMAFTTAAETRLASDEEMNGLFIAAWESAWEAVLNCLVAAKPAT